MRKYFIGIILLLLALSVFPNDVFAKIGVGVGTGKIQVTEQLKPGIIYKLPFLTVINTGDTPSDYAVSVAYQTDQSELLPKKDWFIFSPEKFHLDPGKVQAVDIKLNLPLSVRPGNYFAYLEAEPFLKTQQGKASIGIAAAARLYFTVSPANIFMALYYKIISFWNIYSPWPQRAMMLLGLGIVYLLAKKYLKINVGIKKAQTDVSEQETPRRSRLKRLEKFRKQDKADE